jgi:hypothetical protein
VKLVCTLIILICYKIYFFWRPGGFEQKYWALPWQVLGSIMSDSVNTLETSILLELRFPDFEEHCLSHHHAIIMESVT